MKKNYIHPNRIEVYEENYYLDDYKVKPSDYIPPMGQVNMDPDFINGMKRYQTVHGFTYQKENQTKREFPFYDLAFPFNEYGLAMVANDGKVSWIDKQGTPLNDETNGKLIYTSLYDFSKGEYPLSKMVKRYGNFEQTCYLNTSGKIQEFKHFTGTEIESIQCSFFLKGTEFNEEGIAIAEDKVLFSSGYYMSNREIIDALYESGSFSHIHKKLKGR